MTAVPDQNLPPVPKRGPERSPKKPRKRLEPATWPDTEPDTCNEEGSDEDSPECAPAVVEDYLEHTCNEVESDEDSPVPAIVEDYLDQHHASPFKDASVQVTSGDLFTFTPFISHVTTDANMVCLTGIPTVKMFSIKVGFARRHLKTEEYESSLWKKECYSL